MRYCLPILFGVLSIIVRADQLQPYSAQYDLQDSPLSLKREFFPVEGTRYQVTDRVSAVFGSFRHESVFDITASVVRPLHHTRITSILGIRRRAHIEYDWHKQQVKLAYRKEEQQLPLTDNMFDSLSFEYYLRHTLLQKGEVPSITVKMLSRLQAKEYIAQLEEREVQETIFGSKELVIYSIRKTKAQLHKEKKKAKHAYWKLWFLPDHDYMTVRIFHVSKKGKKRQMDLVSLNYRD